MSTQTVADAVPASAALNRRGVGAAVIGNALEFYDFTTYAFFAVMIGQTFFPAGDSWVSLLASLATFGVGFVTRPIGGILIGSYADRMGRKPAMVLTIVLMAFGTLLLAVTPGYATIGAWAPALIVFARLVQGLALGGEIGPSTSYLLEAAPRNRRGLYASWQVASQGIAVLAAGLIGVALSSVLSSEQMQAWGWRLPFLVGLLIIPVGLYIRRSLPETAGVSTGHAEASTSAVIGRLMRSHLKIVLLIIPLIVTGTVSVYIGNYMTTYAITTLHLPASLSIAATAIGGAAVFVFALVGGWLSDLFGRRVIMIVPRLITLLIAYPAFNLMVEHPGAASLLSMSALLAALNAVTGGATLTAIPEMLPRAVRSSGLSISYAIAAAVFGGTTQFVVAWLIGVTGDPLSPAYYIILTSLIGLAAMMAVPETARRELAN